MGLQMLGQKVNVSCQKFRPCPVLLDALPVTTPTLSKHWRKCTVFVTEFLCCIWL